jgi:phosphoribosylformimino-5-aminoimidazole carboxamide ribotide isomerase
MRLIPAIDLRGGKCVRLRQGDFSAETVFPCAPQDLLERYRSWGADWVHVVDLDAARDGAATNTTTLDALAAAGKVHLQVGGGLRTRAAVEARLNRGAARAVLGSLAVTAPLEVAALVQAFGAQRVTAALDVRIDSHGTPRVAVHGWREQTSISLWDAVSALMQHGVRHVLCTDVGRDGMLDGPNLELYTEAMQRYPHLEWQASGGIRDAADLHALAAIGLAAAISGRALLEDRIAHAELRPFLPNA